MRKVKLLLAAICVAATSFAQNEAGTFGVEINFDPFGANGNGVFSTDGLKVRYFVSEDVAIRGSLGFAFAPTTEFVYDADDELYSTAKSSTFSFGFAPGFEYYVVNTEKTGVYIGAELGFSIGKTRLSVDYEDKDMSDYNSVTKVGKFGFGAGIFTGVNYNITKNLYVGAELGLSYATLKDLPASITEGDETVETKDYTSSSSIGFMVNPSFRFGWNF